MTGVATALVVGLAVWTFYATSRGARARRAVVASMVLLVTEALLGAGLVLGGYVGNNISAGRVVMQSIHFTNTLLLLGSLALTAWWLGDRLRARAMQTGERLATPAWTAVAATIVMGATGSLAALADTLLPSPSLRAALASDFAATSPLLIRMRWVHPVAALVGACLVLWLVVRVRSRLSWVVAGLLGLQFVLGVGDILLLAPVWMQVLHLLGADLYWVALVILAATVVWPSDHHYTQPERH
jgi:cytochrome c oxidase assembly protein subunit 15